MHNNNNNNNVRTLVGVFIPSNRTPYHNTSYVVAAGAAAGAAAAVLCWQGNGEGGTMEKR